MKSIDKYSSIIDTRDLIEYELEKQTEILEIWNEDNPQYEITHIHTIVDGYIDEVGLDLSYIADILDVDLINQSVGVFKVDDSLIPLIEDYSEFRAFYDEVSECSDFTHGTPLINDDYFVEYTEDFVGDCGYISRDFPSWIAVDWEATAKNIQVDYTYANWGDQQFWFRNC